MASPKISQQAAKNFFFGRIQYLPPSDRTAVENMAALKRMQAIQEKITARYSNPQFKSELLYLLALEAEIDHLPPQAKELYERVVALSKDSLKLSAAGSLRRLNLLGKIWPVAMRTLDGNPINLQSSQDKVTLLFFWREESAKSLSAIKDIRDVYDRAHKRGFAVIGMAIGMEPDKVKASVARHNLPWTQCICSGSLETKYGISGTPVLILLDQFGRVVDLYGWPDLEQKVNRLLDKGKVRPSQVSCARGF
jgi:hypothetical protein